jgi:hypothetical protein
MSCNCNDCDTLGIAVGSAGRDGVSIIANNLTTAATLANTNLTTLQTIVIPGGTLKTNGSKLIVKANFNFSSIGNVKFAYLTDQYGTSTVVSSGVTGNTANVQIEWEINRISATLAYISTSVSWNNLALSMGAAPSAQFLQVFPSMPINFANPYTIFTQGQNTVASAANVTSLKLDAVLYIK